MQRLADPTGEIKRQRSALSINNTALAKRCPEKISAARFFWTLSVRVTRRILHIGLAVPSTKTIERNY
jgi:hypothetical protein